MTAARTIIIEQMMRSNAQFGLDYTRAKTADAIIAALSAQGYQIIKFVKRQRPPIVFESDDDDPAATPPGEA